MYSIFMYIFLLSDIKRLAWLSDSVLAFNLTPTANLMSHKTADNNNDNLYVNKILLHLYLYTHILKKIFTHLMHLEWSRATSTLAFLVYVGG